MITAVSAQLVLVAAAACGQAGAIELTGPLASSGGVELVELRLQRRLKGRIPVGQEAAKGELEVVLWFPHEWAASADFRQQGTPDFYLYYLHDFGNVVDDTGKELGHGRPAASDDPRPREFRFFDALWLLNNPARKGPLYRMVLPTPAPQAKTLARIAGSLDVSAARHLRHTVEVPLQEGEQTLAEGVLKNFPLQMKITSAQGETQVELQARTDLGRLSSWDIMEGKRPLSAFAFRTANDEKTGRTTQTRTYRTPRRDDWRLHLSLIDPVETKRFAFDFRDVPLP